MLQTIGVKFEKYYFEKKKFLQKVPKLRIFFLFCPLNSLYLFAVIFNFFKTCLLIVLKLRTMFSQSDVLYLFTAFLLKSIGLNLSPNYLKKKLFIKSTKYTTSFSFQMELINFCCLYDIYYDNKFQVCAKLF